MAGGNCFTLEYHGLLCTSVAFFRVHLRDSRAVLFSAFISLRLGAFA
jgi:hypothetical protein